MQRISFSRQLRFYDHRQRASMNALLSLFFISILASVANVAVAQERHQAEEEYKKIFAQGEKAEQTGDELQESKNFDEARASYKRAIYFYHQTMIAGPRFRDVYVRLGRVYGVLGRYENATAVLRRAEREWPESMDIKELLALNLVLANRLEEGLPVLEEVSRARPSNVPVLTKLVETYYALSQWEKVVDALRRLLPQLPDSRFVVMLGQSLMNLNKFEDAVKEFARVPPSAKAYVDARIGLGDALRRSKGADAARVVYEELEKAKNLAVPADKKQLLELHFRIADVLVDVKRYGEARERYKQLQNEAPNDPRGYYGAGRCFLAAGQLRDAETQLQLAKSKNAKLHRPWHTLAETYLAMNRMQDALAHAQKAFELDATNYRYENFIGRVMRRSGKIDQALALHERLQKTNPKSFEVETERGHDLYYRKELNRAEEAYTRAVRLKKAAAEEAKQGLVLLMLHRAEDLIRKKSYDAAQKILSQAHGYGVLKNEINTALAFIALEQGNPKQVLALFDGDAAASTSTQTHRLLTLGRAHLALKNGAKALEALRQIQLQTLSPTEAPAVILTLAAAELTVGDYSNAIGHLRSLGSSESTDSLLAQGLLGEATKLWQENNIKDAQKDLTELKERNLERYLSAADLQRAYFLNVLTLAESGQIGAAKAALAKFRESQRKGKAEEYLAAKYSDKTARSMLDAYLSYQLGDFEDASKRLETLSRGEAGQDAQANQLYVASVRAWATELYSKGDYRRSKAVVDRAKSAFKSATPTDELLFAALDYELNKHEAAAAVFQKLENELPEAQANLGIYFDEIRKDKKAAYDRYLAFLKKRPNADVEAWVKAKQRIFGY